MNVSEQSLGDAVLLRPQGRIDLTNADAFKDAMAAAMAKAKRGLVVDLAGVDYISSAGLRSLMIVFKTGKADGKGLAVAALQPLLKEIFTISRFHLVFPLFDTVEEARLKFAPPA